ncbi:hypothetical protein A8L34_06620 [Bacillus sp. FJAT-27264]|uniref:hypothetical protein n=1 Tax=Paenibacillus sp. (strain DSM 101736 / FJAT-27264) TaxID=1850362 RepID=UPI000807C72A|nr:hypothetical protein [Bacillus sp. FJAT-27264]OBZ19196.1 hypothetical protein A8L34_06620 [Bacillus sp. FJAT-27264]
MKNKADKEIVKIEDTNWYSVAGKNPLREQGFTPELMLRIEQAAVHRHLRYSIKFKLGKRRVLTGLAAALLVILLVWPNIGLKQKDLNAESAIKTQSASASQPFPSPGATKYLPTFSSADFEFNGINYFMTLPLDRDKNASYAADTSEGILWSPAPPMKKNQKTKLLYPTEPYTLYLSSKEQTELSPYSARRVYTFPLYAGGAQVYNFLIGIYGFGEHVFLATGAQNANELTAFPLKVSVLNMKQVASGETVKPREFLTLDPSLNDQIKSFLAFDQQHESILIVDLAIEQSGNNKDRVRLYDLKSQTMRELDSAIEIEKEGSVAITSYKLDGVKRTAEIFMKIGWQWYADEAEH